MPIALERTIEEIGAHLALALDVLDAAVGDVEFAA